MLSLPLLNKTKNLPAATIPPFQVAGIGVNHLTIKPKIKPMTILASVWLNQAYKGKSIVPIYITPDNTMANTAIILFGSNEGTTFKLPLGCIS